RCAVSVTLILLVLRQVHWVALRDVLRRTDWHWLALGSAFTPVLIVGLARRWLIFVRQQGIAVRFLQLLSTTWIGQFFNSILPGSTGGDVVKIYRLCRLAPDRKAAVAASVLVDRLLA